MVTKFKNFYDQKFKLFLDLDGVFADFDGRVKLLSGGKHPNELHKKDLWKLVASDRNFFINLLMMPDSLELWHHVKKYNPMFLTGAPNGEHFCDQKRKWVQVKFGHEYVTHVVKKKDKKNFSGQDCILIDDNDINIEEWISAGGCGILHKSVKKTIIELKKALKSYE